MTNLSVRTTNLIFKNQYTIFATVALVIAGIWLGSYAVGYGYDQYARSTFMKPFYEKVAVAKTYSQSLPLGNLVSQASVHAQEMSGNNKYQSWLKNCTVPGTYFDYRTNKQLSDVSLCSYGYMSYFGINSLDGSTVDKAAQQMQSAGWTLTDNPANQEIEKGRANTTTLGSYSFTRQDDINATMVFINKAVWRQNSDSFSAYPEWKFISHTQDSHEYFLAVLVSHTAKLQGHTFIEN